MGLFACTVGPGLGHRSDFRDMGVSVKDSGLVSCLAGGLEALVPLGLRGDSVHPVFWQRDFADRRWSAPF